MVNLDEIKKSLDSNIYLTNDIKDNLMGLIIIFNNSFPNVDLSNLNERLKTLNIIRGSKYLIRGTSFYNPNSNELLINKVNLDENIDCKHILMRELLNIITAKDSFTGLNINNEYEALNIGITEMLANYLVGNEDESEYEDEVVATNMMAVIVGQDKLIDAYFNNDASLIEVE